MLREAAKKVSPPVVRPIRPLAPPPHFFVVGPISEELFLLRLSLLIRIRPLKNPNPQEPHSSPEPQETTESDFFVLMLSDPTLQNQIWIRTSKNRTQKNYTWHSEIKTFIFLIVPDQNLKIGIIIL